MNYVKTTSLSTPGIRMRNYICRCMMEEATRVSHLALIVNQRISESVDKVSGLSNVMSIYEAAYSIDGDSITLETYIPIEHNGDIVQIAFLTGKAPEDEVVSVESITKLEKTDQYSLDFKVVLRFNL